MHLMVDLETWGTNPGNAIRSIGAVVFDPYGERIGESFYANITDESNSKVGLMKDPKTEKWWSDQDPAVQSILFNNQRALPEVLESFIRFYVHTGSHYLWSHGKIFDIPILQIAYVFCGIKPPWDFRNVRDTRTIFHFIRDPHVEIRGIKHYALDDAENQARKVQKAFGESTRRIVTEIMKERSGSVPTRSLSEWENFINWRPNHDSQGGGS